MMAVGSGDETHWKSPSYTISDGHSPDVHPLASCFGSLMAMTSTQNSSKYTGCRFSQNGLLDMSEPPTLTLEGFSKGTRSELDS